MEVIDFAIMVLIFLVGATGGIGAFCVMAYRYQALLEKKWNAEWHEAKKQLQLRAGDVYEIDNPDGCTWLAAIDVKGYTDEYGRVVDDWWGESITVRGYTEGDARRRRDLIVGLLS